MFSTPTGGAAWCFIGVEGRARMAATVRKSGGKHPLILSFFLLVDELKTDVPVGEKRVGWARGTEST